MAVAQIISYLSIFFWLLPPIRQYKERFFIYFLITALMDPMQLIAVHFFHTHNYYVHPIASVFLLYSINLSSDNLKKYWYFHMLFVAAFILGLFLLQNHIQLILFLHFLILIKFLKIAFVSLHKFNIINVFLFMLVFYELSVVINQLVFLSNYEIKVIFFYTTLFFQILIAIFFTIFKEDNPSLKITLKSTPQSSSH